MVPTVNHWLGQPEVIARFKIALEASWNDACPLPHMLFVGPPGVGKTELSHVAAREMGVRIHERIAQTLTSSGAVNALLLSAEDKEIVFLDEIHELDPQLQTVLYRAMEDRQVYGRRSRPCLPSTKPNLYLFPHRSARDSARSSSFGGS